MAWNHNMCLKTKCPNLEHRISRLQVTNGMTTEGHAKSSLTVALSHKYIHNEVSEQTQRLWVPEKKVKMVTQCKKKVLEGYYTTSVSRSIPTYFRASAWLYLKNKEGKIDVRVYKLARYPTYFMRRMENLETPYHQCQGSLHSILYCTNKYLHGAQSRASVVFVFIKS